MTAISSQGTKILMWNGVAPVANPITSITKAKPAVVTLVAAGLVAVGDIVVPKGTGYKSLDDMPFRVSVAAAGVVTLEDSDTTAELGAGTSGSLDEYHLIELCVANFSTKEPAGTTHDVTTMCDVARKTLTGLPGLGSWSAAGYWDGSDAAQLVARNAYRTGALQVFQLAFNDGSGVAFRGALNQFDIGTAVDAPVSITLGGTISGYVNRVTTP